MLDRQQIHGLLANRKKAREEKDWTSSDALRNALDEIGVFIFDQKDGSQFIHFRDKSFFVHMEKLVDSVMYDSRISGTMWNGDYNRIFLPKSDLTLGSTPFNKVKHTNV